MRDGGPRTGLRSIGSRAREASLLLAVIAACAVVYALTAISTSTASAVAVLVVIAVVFWLIHEDLVRHVARARGDLSATEGTEP